MKGRKIAHYKIIDQIGEGGMGVVYKAEDTKLKRTVALKFLPLQSTANKQEKTRFTREAQAAAALNHPNIATVYAIEEDDGQAFIVMEYLEGKSLREIVEEGPLNFSKAIKIASQMAYGLQAAHDKGVVHRDIKSTNVMVTEAGVVKIMDFGLAKLSGTSMLTKAGTTLGTAAYMSPEQARGEDVDYRTDIWSLGMVLYEMVCGQVPFKGDYEQALVYAIMNEPAPPLTSLRTGVPMEMERIVNKCLAKDPNSRYQNANEIPVDLKSIDVSSTGGSSIITAPVQTPSMVMAQKRPGRWKKVVGWCAAAAAVLAIAVAAWQFGVSSQTSRVRRLAVNTAGTLGFSGSTALDITKDGKKIIYVGKNDEGRQLFLRAVDAFTAQPIQGTKGASAPFFSPDGQWVGFYADGKLKKVSVFGGVPVVVAGVSAFDGACWGDDNLIYAACQDETGTPAIAKVNADGGQPEVIVQPATDGKSQRFAWPQFLPGDVLLFTVLNDGSRNPDDGKIVTYEIANGQQNTVLEGGIYGRYSDTGHIVAAWSGGLLAAPFDVSKLQVTGPTVPVLDGLYFDAGQVPSYAFSEDGDLIFVAGPTEVVQRELRLASFNGQTAGLLKTRDNFSHPCFSPNGKSVAVMINRDNEMNIWVADVASGQLRKLTGGARNMNPVWAPSGEEIAYASESEGNWQIKSVALSEGAAPGVLYKRDHKIWPVSWSPDGKNVLYVEANPDSGQDINVLALDKEITSTTLLASAADESQATISSDGRWLAYISNQSGKNLVYVCSYPGLTMTTQVSESAGAWPAWDASGERLFYRQGNLVMSARISMETDTLQVLDRQQLTELLSRDDYFALSPKGEQILFVPEQDLYETSNISMVLNWFQDLDAQVASGKTMFGFKF